jgi:multidrug efflux pump subunit AcrA (membrane-fusion protein)
MFKRAELGIVAEIVKVCTLAEADAALSVIDSRKREVAADLAELEGQLSEAEGQLGEAVLEGDDSAVQTVAALRDKVDGLRAALAALEKRNVAAKRNRRVAEAADLRRQAAEKRAQLSELEAATGEFLRGLSRLEEVSYTRAILAAQRTPGDWRPGINAATKDIDYLPPSDVFRAPDSIAPFILPLSIRLHLSILQLEEQALEIETELNPPPEPLYAPIRPPLRPPDSEYGSVDPFRIA